MYSLPLQKGQLKSLKLHQIALINFSQVPTICFFVLHKDVLFHSRLGSVTQYQVSLFCFIFIPFVMKKEVPRHLIYCHFVSITKGVL